MGCCFCRVLLKEAEASGFDTITDAPENNAEDAPLTQAFLSEPMTRRGLFRLDFRMGPSRRLATFFLQQSQNESEGQIYTPMAVHTHSTEVLKLARHWISTCTSPDHPTCPNETFDNPFNEQRRFYPTRLIELPPLDLKDEDCTIRLIVTRDYPIQPYVSPGTDDSSGNIMRDPTLRRGNPLGLRKPIGVARQGSQPKGHYVTLSHCWGGKLDFFLNKSNQRQLEAGIPLRQLPLTFQEAIHFSRRLRKDIRYIWIDALCIIQEDEEDWNTESVKMYDVYRNSFCNISATAARNSGFGMTYPRDPQHLWEDEVNLNTNGIRDPIRDKTNAKLLGNEPLIQRCSVQDASFWKRSVEGAPVNLRAWVLQERLLAPRVLHFCKDQVAWECRHLDAAECLPLGISPLEIKSGDVIERQRLKWLIPQEYGVRALAPDLFELSFLAHENWKRIVERYSTTGLTKDKDRLIALAGIAELFSSQIGENVTYVAGIWEKWLASQLLWRVDPRYQEAVLLYPEPRPEVYCAPTFSWASIKAGQAIICGETLKEDDLFFSVKHIHISLAFERQRFGEVVDGCYLELEGMLHPIEIMKRRIGSHDRYRWRLLEDTTDGDRELTNLHLDSLEYDGMDIRGRKAGMFCMPANKNSKGITCLILQLKASGGSVNRYRRIGLAVVPSYETAYATLTPRTAREIAQDLKGEVGKKMAELEKEVQRLKMENRALKAEKGEKSDGVKEEVADKSLPREAVESAARIRIRLE